MGHKILIAESSSAAFFASEANHTAPIFPRNSRLWGHRPVITVTEV
jgi:hypothetical protein